MKQKLKRLQLLFYISLAGLLLFSCNKEDNIDQNLQEIKSSHRKFEDLIKQQKFSNAISKIRKVKSYTNPNQNLSSRTIMEEQYDFTISNNLVNVLENDSLISYTILITRTNTIATEFENLIVQVDSQNEVSAYIMKYIDDSEITKENFNLQTFQGQKTIIPIVYNASPVNSLSDYEVCRMVKSWYCYGEGHHSSQIGCTQGFPLYEEVCVRMGGGGGPTGGTGGTGSTPGGGSTGSGTPVITSPNLPEYNEPIDPNTPCGKLQKHIQDKIIKSGAINLRGESENTVEKGFTFDLTDTGYTRTSQISSTSNSCRLKSATSTTVGSNHTHQKGKEGSPSHNFPMMDVGDLQSLCEYTNVFDNGPAEDPLLFAMITVGTAADGMIYLITPNNPANFKIFSNQLYDTDNIRIMNLEIQKIYLKLVPPNGENHEVSKDKLAQAFLTYINNPAPTSTNFDVSLYSIPNDNASLDAGIFSKIELDPTATNGVKKTPCK